MKKLSIFTCLLFVFASVESFAQEVGEKVYKEIIVNGEKASKWFEVKAITEYDAKGNIIHDNPAPIGGEKWYEYDAKGNQIHIKWENGEQWIKYNDLGKRIHTRSTEGKEEWYEYDAKGNEVHVKTNYNYESWKEYDVKGNIIYEKIDGIRFGSDEKWYEYDAKGNRIHEKWSDGFDIWSEYDARGNLIHEKRSNDIEDLYEYDTKGNLKYHKQINGIPKNNEYWYDEKGNKIHSIEGEREWWTEYNNEGKEVHRKYLNAGELWVKYDKNG